MEGLGGGSGEEGLGGGSRVEGLWTHRGAAHKDDDEGPDDPADAHQPGHPEEEDDAKDVLDARQVHAHQGTQLRSLGEGERQTERETQRESQTETETGRERERQRERHRDRERAR